MIASVPDISVVIPVFNEAPNLHELYERVIATLESMDRTFEVLFIDDGSSDGSFEILTALQGADRHLRIVRLARNFGQTPALYAGFANVRGRIIVQLDADLQNPPEELVKLIAKLDEGYDVVQGWREIRQDTGLRRYASKILNAIVSWATNVRILDLGCGLKGYRREVIDNLGRFTHHTRYLPAELVWLGASIAEVKVAHCERAGGDSKYSMWTLLRLNFDMIASVTTVPIKFVGFLGLILSLVGFGMGALIGVKRIVYGSFNQFVTVTALFFVMAGLQLIATGLLCEYISRIFIEAQNKPYYIIREIREAENDK